jgi:hypothetical protein
LRKAVREFYAMANQKQIQIKMQQTNQLRYSIIRMLCLVIEKIMLINRGARGG